MTRQLIARVTCALPGLLALAAIAGCTASEPPKEFERIEGAPSTPAR